MSEGVRPPLFLVTGSPTAEELAAVVAVLSARSGTTPAPARPAGRSRWATPRLRGPLAPGPGAWRAAALPG